MDKATKAKLLQAATNKLKKQLGEDVILDLDKPVIIERIPTGSLVLDLFTGGGIAKGRITELFGEPSSGKTSFAYSLCAQAQKQQPDKLVLYLDSEQAVSLDYMEEFGVKVDSDHLIFSQPDTIEESFTILEEYVSTGLVSLVVLDSVGSSITEAQKAKGYTENTMGSLAKKMSEGLNKLKSLLNETNTPLLAINTTYDKMSLYGGKETRGGSALKFNASQRISITKRDLMSEDGSEDILGQVIKVKMIKSKISKPYIEAETLLLFGKGFDEYTEIVDIAVEKGFINKGGAWFSFLASDGKTEIKLQGKFKVIDYFKNTEEDFQYYKKMVLDSMSNLNAEKEDS